MRKNKRWIAITALAGVTAAALITAVVVKTNLDKGPENTISISQAGTDLGVKQIEVLKGSNGEIIGYKVNVEAKGFGATPMELAVGFNATADTVTGVEVIAHSETEGYGANMTKPEFLDQFKNVKLPVYIEGMSVSSDDVLQVLSIATNDVATVTAATAFEDGTYEVVGEPDAKGYTSQVTLTVEGGKITEVVWDCVDAEGKLKSVMSQKGEYVMTEDGATWYEQAQLLAQNVIENQGVSALTMNADGKTDAITSVSITISEFVAQVQEAMEMAAKEETSPVTLKDGVFEIVGEPDAKGYTSQVTLTVEGGKITEVIWDCVDAEGKRKSIMSQNGEYVMTEDGATWYEQAQLLAQNVIENQGVSALTMNEDGKTDAIASVSITISEFVSQVEQALLASAGGETPIVDEPIVEEPDKESPTEIDGTKVDAISGATISTKAFLTAINNSYDYLINNVVK